MVIPLQYMFDFLLQIKILNTNHGAPDYNKRKWQKVKI